MALDALFSVTEMKNGLVEIGRVDELVSVMQKEKDSTVRSVDEKVRQWSTVANVLAATESKSVLEHFVQLGGVAYVDQWLQEILQHNNNTGNSSLDDSTCELLGALEKLSAENKAPAFSGILVSVKNLIGHKSSRVQERAKVLYDLLSHGMEEECSYLKNDECHDEVKTLNATISLTSSTLKHETVNVFPAESGADEDKQAIVLSGSELKYPISMKQNFLVSTHGQVDVNDSVIKVTPVQPNQHLMEESSAHLAGGTNSAETWTKSGEQNSDKFVGKRISCISSSLSGANHVSPVNTLDAQSVAEHAVVKDADSKEIERIVATPLEDITVDSQDHASTGQNDGICSNEAHDFSVTDCISGKTENLNTGSLGEAKNVNIYAPDILKKDGRCEDSATKGGISKSITDVSANEMNSIADVEVADKFEEITNRKEMLCTSSQKYPEATVVDPQSPDSVNDKQDHPMSEQQNQMAEQNFTGAFISSKEGEDNLKDSKNEKGEDSTCQQNSSQVIEAAGGAKKGKSTIGFDLNEDSTSDEMDQAKTSVPSVSLVLTPKATKLESADAKGQVVYSGSATIAALHPGASDSLRTKDAQKTLSVEGSNSLKQRKDGLDFDLNVSLTPNAIPVDIPESSGFPSGESSVEVCSTIAKRLNLDLNSSVDEGDHSASAVSGNSSMQPSMKNLDLNDNPPPHESHGDPAARDVRTESGRFQADGSYVLLMGALIPKEVFPIRSTLSKEPDVSSQTRSFLPTESDITTQTRSFLSKEPIPVSSMSANYVQSGSAAQAYVPLPPGIGYNNHHMEPPFMSLSSEMYGSVPPYTVDPRSIATRQQAMGSFIAVPSSYSRPSFPISTPSASSGYNWFEPSQPNHGVSSGLFIGGVENRDQGSSSRHTFISGQPNISEETGSSSQFMRLKRKEPDNGCDPNLGNFRRQPPWL